MQELTYYSLNSLRRWSCKEKVLPDIASIKSIHVYDFDNTLFSSPLPNPQLWHSAAIGQLQAFEMFAQGGWWHNPDILSATGEGLEIEEKKGWESWWNESVVQLVRNSIADPDAVVVLLTGRGETNFAGLINRMCEAKKLDFDMIVLKPEVGPAGQRFASTLDFKQAYFRDLIFTYHGASSLRVYEDRPKHVKAFRDFFDHLNKPLSNPLPGAPPPEREPFSAEVVPVCELKSALDPEVEVTAVQRAITRHNQIIKTGGKNWTRAPHRFYQIKEHFVYFGYLISRDDSARLITLCNCPAHMIDSGEVKYMASSILIAPFYPGSKLVEKVGGRGHKVKWKVTGVARFEDRLWAARVEPLGGAQVHTQDETRMVVLAIRKGSRQIEAQRIKNWAPVKPEKQFEFETEVNDKMMLRIDEVHAKSINRNGIHAKPERHRVANKRKLAQSTAEAGEDKENGRGSDQQPQQQQREDGTWVAVTAAQKGTHHHHHHQNDNNRAPRPRQPFSQSNNKRSSGAMFNNTNNPSINPNAGTPQSATSNSKQKGGGRHKGGKTAQPAYKSLDDFNNGYDAGLESAGGGTPNATSSLVMNY